MLNRVSYQGHLTRDIEKKVTQSGISTAQFTIAWNDKYKTAAGVEQETKCFLRCKAWRGLADFIDKYFHNKGTEMVVEGRLETEEWTDKDGNRQSQTVLNVDKVHFCGKRQDGVYQPQSMAEAPQSSGTPLVDPDGELPF